VSSATANQPFVFTPGSSPGDGIGSDALVNETRREIAEIVREIATAVRSDRTAGEFLTMLVDRILKAMAAEGVMVWQHCRAGDQAEIGYHCIQRLGRITDQSIPTESTAAHSRLLLEVAGHGQPVVVPATPGATDSKVPANPMQVAVALVPIECEASPGGAEYLLEVFLEPDCGVATQRGYLRFVAQMADLAGEFLRADQLRRLRRNRTLSGAVDTTIARLHAAEDRQNLEATIVDGAVDLFGFDRVGLCSLEPKVSLTAVSHVNTIDAKSSAALQLRQAATYAVDADGCAWINSEENPAASPTSGDSLVLRAVVRSEAGFSRRLVCMQVASADPICEECRGELIRFMQHANLALRNLTRFEAIPGGRLLASLAPAFSRSGNRKWRTMAIIAAAITLISFVALFPVPLVVYSPASIRPADVQILSAPRDAVVERIHVHHGQEVSAGEKLLTMADPALEERITALVGRQAVLVQQQSHWTEVLVDTGSHRLDRMEQVQGERSLVTEEIRSINDQLAVLERVTQSLVIRADRSGTVDAWQIEQRLQSRPLRRGDHLLQVIAQDSSWVVDVHVPQSRISHVQDAQAAGQSFAARVSLESKPDESFDAKLLQIGPSVVAGQGEVPSTAVLLSLSDPASNMISSTRDTSHQSGAPARVMFHCGSAPTAYVLFQDLIRSARSHFSLYLATDTGTS
jgi:multidrug efflux pump subunit AcrA (membrane-fusion protein)